MAWFLGLYGAFPVDRDRRDPQALRTALNILRAQQVLGMFPEGTRSTTGEMQEFHTGAIRLAIKAAAPIIPLGIWGATACCRPAARSRAPAAIASPSARRSPMPTSTTTTPPPPKSAAAADDLEQRIAALIQRAEGLWQK